MYSYPSTAAASSTGMDTASMSSLHQDIIQTHILTRLDGQTLASVGCASPQLHTLCSDDKLWTRICNSTWPSTDDPRVQDAVSTFPSGHRSFFSDSFPNPNYHGGRSSSQLSQTPTSELISAVDVKYNNELIFSKVQVTDTAGEWFQSSPFRVDLLDPKEILPTSIKFEAEDGSTYRTSLEKHLTVSWIVIDPTRKRSVNLSTTRPVSVKRHWLTGDVQVRYAMVIPSDGFDETHSEYVSCNIDVTCGGKEGGEMHVSEVSMQVQDMDGKSLSGKDSLVILQEVMGSERRKKGQNGEEKKQKYEEYQELKRARREKKETRERRLDMVCIASGVTIFVAFCAFMFFR